MTEVLIIEDEVSAQNHLVKLLSSLEPDCRILSTLSTVEQSVRWLKAHDEPDLIFMDIHLSDGISFDILTEVQAECPIIFITAYDQYAIKAFKTTGIDYLLKPVTKDDLAAALQKFRKLTQRDHEEQLIKSLEVLGLMRQGMNPSYAGRFLFKSGNRLIPVKTGDIAWFHRKNDLVFVRTFADQTCLADHSLNQLQKLLDPGKFFRLNRQLLVNLEAVADLKLYKPGQVTVSLVPEFPGLIHLSQERSSRLKAVLGAQG